MKTQITYPHLKFFFRKTYKNPVKIMTKETYDEANSYEPMQYRPENWERFNKNQTKEYKFFENQLKENGYIVQAGKIAVLNHQDFLDKKTKIESEDGFIKWFE